MGIELVIFDCDGVLFRSEDANVGFYNAVLEQAGEPPLSEPGAAACHSLASTQLFEMYYGDRPTLLAKIRAIAQSVDYTPFFSLMHPRADLYEALAELGTNYKLAMATNRGKTVQSLLEHFSLRSYFDEALGVDDVGRPKPHPDMLLACLDRVGVSASSAVYVGDQDTDRQAAEAAGIAFIGMGQVAASACMRVDELAQLPGLLASL